MQRSNKLWAAWEFGQPNQQDSKLTNEKIISTHIHIDVSPGSIVWANVQTICQTIAQMVVQTIAQAIAQARAGAKFFLIFLNSLLFDSTQN